MEVSEANKCQANAGLTSVTRLVMGMQASALDCLMSYTNSFKQDEPNVGSLRVNIVQTSEIQTLSRVQTFALTIRQYYITDHQPWNKSDYNDLLPS